MLLTTLFDKQLYGNWTYNYTITHLPLFGGSSCLVYRTIDIMGLSLKCAYIMNESENYFYLKKDRKFNSNHFSFSFCLVKYVLLVSNFISFPEMSKIHIITIFIPSLQMSLQRLDRPVNPRLVDEGWVKLRKNINPKFICDKLLFFISYYFLQ